VAQAWRRRRRLLHEPARCQRPDGSYKASYRSAAKARRAIIQQRGSSFRTSVPRLFTYQCPKCGLWHITSQPQP
jgi:hypothetical protein